MLSVGSLFSGIGGLELGLERAGFGPVRWQAEADAYCRRVLARHWPEARRYSDVRDIDADAADVGLVCGGFPCQPVSTAGRRRAQLDERWLWPEFVRIIGALDPAAVVVENVVGLRSAGLSDVLADLAAVGMDAEWACLAAADLGAPHVRRRIFIVGVRPGAHDPEPGWLARACDAARAELVQRARASDAPHAREVRWDRTSTTRIVRGLLAEGEEEQRARVPQAVWFGDRGPAPAPAPAGPALEGGAASPFGPLGDAPGWASDSGWEVPPPPLRGMDDGLSEGLDGPAVEGVGDDRRIGALGNAVVPQCGELIGRALARFLADRNRGPA